MSDMGFGYNSYPDPDDPSQMQQSADKTPQWFRDKLEADSKALKEMREQMDQLRAENRQVKVAREFESRGYAPGAAAFYNGDPDKVDDWLTTNGSYLVKQDGMSAAQQNLANGTPASTIPTEGQAGIQRMTNAGNSGQEVTLTGDDAIAAALAATKTPEEFQAVARANGWNYDIFS